LTLFYLEEDMKMSEKNDFIQLPPIKKDTPSEVVSIIWQYLKLPEESRKRVTADLIDVDENCEKEDFQIPDLYDIVPKEEIAEFEETMRKIIAGIISQARACLKNHSRNLHAPLCGIFHPNSVAALIRAKYPTNCDAHLAESLFQTRSSSVATWVYVQKYVKHKTLDEMLQEWKGASQFIIVMDTWFERLMAE